MAYSTLADLQKLLPVDVLVQLTDDENLGPQTIDAANLDHAAIIARVDEAIATADGLVDGYCGAKYAVPLAAPVPPIVKGLSMDLAIYYLYARRTIPEKIAVKYDKAVATLKDISRGLLTLGVQDEPAPSRADAASTNKTASDRVFTRDKMGGF